MPSLCLLGQVLVRHNWHEGALAPPVCLQSGTTYVRPFERHFDESVLSDTRCSATDLMSNPFLSFSVIYCYIHLYSFVLFPYLT